MKQPRFVHNACLIAVAFALSACAGSPAEDVSAGENQGRTPAELSMAAEAGLPNPMPAETSPSSAALVDLSAIAEPGEDDETSDEYPRSVVPARSYVTSDPEVESILREQPIVGFLIYSKPPTPETRARYVAVCDAFHRNLSASTDPSENGGILPIAVTYWPTRIAGLVVRPAGNDCEHRVDNYHFSLAASVGERAGTRDLGSEYLLGLGTRGDPRGITMIVNLSSVPVANLDSVFAVWRGRITASPTEWDAIAGSGRVSPDLVDRLGAFDAPVAAYVPF